MSEEQQSGQDREDRIHALYASEADNTATAAVNVKPKLPVLVVDGQLTSGGGAARGGGGAADLQNFPQAAFLVAAMQPVDVCMVLDSTLALAWSELSGRARIVREYQTVPLARANVARLGQVFLNLILNALDAMSGRPLGERELGLRIERDAAGNIVVRVSDTGRGIAPQHVERIFDPFFTTNANGHGTGLGLAICHQLVADLGGDIAVEATSDQGTTLRVTLPSADLS